MQRVENAIYVHARQSCYLCLNPHDGVDTEVQIDFEGVLFLCRGCIHSLALTAGFVVDDDRTEEIAALTAALDESRQAQNDAEHIVIELERKAKEMLDRRMKRVREAKKVEVG